MEPETIEELQVALEEVFNEIVILASKAEEVKMKYLRKRTIFNNLYLKAQKIDPTLPDMPNLPV